MQANVFYYNTGLGHPGRMRWLLALGVLLSTVLIHADTVTERPRVVVPESDSSLPADKFFADPRWDDAGVTSFPLSAPSNVKFPSPPESTHVRILWNKEYLLVRFDCEDRDVITLRESKTVLPERDLPYFKADAVEVFLDPVGDGHMYMEFQFSPTGGVFDAGYFCTTTPRSHPDFTLESEIIDRDLFFIKEWNLTGLRTESRIWPASEGRGWSVIAAFPAKGILQRLGKTQFEAGMALKVNLVRFDYFPETGHAPDITNWAPVLGGCAHISPAGMGTLVLGAKP